MKIAVAMSGGVDSSVAALLLAEQGHDVFGISMRLYDSPEGSAGGPAAAHRCCGATDIADARRVAGEIGIPFYVANMKDLFQTAVIDRFVEGYAAGTTPIPCVACNAEVKFKALLARARGMGADLLATGHYARIARDGDRHRLLKAVDPDRDQSYYLHHLTQRELAQLSFPVGVLEKREVRARAEARGLSVACKPDSQEICFVGTGQYIDFLEARRSFPRGAIREASGEVKGEHAGIHRYTVGQHRGLGLGGGERRYVLALEPETNTVVVGPESGLFQDRCMVSALSWVAGHAPGAAVRARARVRARHAEAWAEIHTDGTDATVVFDEPQRGIAPGQSAVFYRDDEVLGGGVIVRSAGTTTV
ncbi:MAG: tRNA 2-thiouridine(34) synthase MnmA [Acidobacteriota bacterium]